MWVRGYEYVLIENDIRSRIKGFHTFSQNLARGSILLPWIPICTGQEVPLRRA